MDMWLCITLLVPCEQNVFSKRLKAALLEFRLLTGSRRRMDQQLQKPAKY